MGKKGYSKTAEKKLLKWVGIAGNISVLTSDILNFNYKEFNAKYDERYGQNIPGRGKKVEEKRENSFRGTIRRMKIFSSKEERIAFEPKPKEKVKKVKVKKLKKKVPFRVKNAYEGFTVGNLREVWKLKKGKKKVSFQQVNILVKYKIMRGKKKIDKYRTVGGKRIKIPEFMTFSSGVSFELSLSKLLERAKDKYEIWKERMKTKYLKGKQVLFIISETTQVYRFLK